MEIQRCNKCGSKFNYIDVLDSFGWGYKPVVCRKCGAKHNMKMRYILTIASILCFPILFMSRICSLATTIKLKILIAAVYIIYMVVMVGVYPFVIRYAVSEEEI